MDRSELNVNEFIEWVGNDRNARYYKDPIENIIHDFLKERENRAEPKLGITVDGESIRKVIDEKVEEAFKNISFGIIEEETDVEKELETTKSNILISIDEMVRSGKPQDICRARELADIYRNISR